MVAFLVAWVAVILAATGGIVATFRGFRWATGGQPFYAYEVALMILCWAGITLNAGLLIGTVLLPALAGQG